MGLAFKKLSENYSTVLDNLKDQGQISSKIFSLYLGDNKVGVADTIPNSAIIFGGYDLFTYAQNSIIRYVNSFSSTGYWAASLKN